MQTKFTYKVLWLQSLPHKTLLAEYIFKYWFKVAVPQEAFKEKVFRHIKVSQHDAVSS